MKPHKWRIDIVDVKSVGLFSTGRSYITVEAKLAELEDEGWTIHSVSPAPNLDGSANSSVQVMVVCYKERS